MARLEVYDLEWDIDVTLCDALAVGDHFPADYAAMAAWRPWMPPCAPAWQLPAQLEAVL